MNMSVRPVIVGRRVGLELDIKGRSAGCLKLALASHRDRGINDAKDATGAG
jgi:hypothetical protein